MFKKILLMSFLIPSSVYAKSYEVNLSPCDIGSNCRKCYEIVKLTYIVDEKTKQVFVSGRDIAGKEIKELIENCQIIDTRNWNCDSAQLVTSVKNGVVVITNKPESSMTRNKKEICLVKQ